MASPVDLDDVVPRQDELDTVASAEVRTVLENIFVRNEGGELIGIPSIEEVYMCVHVCTCVYMYTHVYMVIGCFCVDLPISLFSATIFTSCG